MPSCRPDDAVLTIRIALNMLAPLGIFIFFLLVGISLLTFCGGSPYKAFIDDGGGAGAGWTGC